ncbi:MAG: type II toxin-antitoxin system RelE/ParE family toxin [Saprospiraceae bacterium]|nr:type II toxin-antitoxin system RelE/ParE family toxin [Saprospiraceae bacterium]
MKMILWTDTAEEAYLNMLQVLYAQSADAALLLGNKMDALLDRLETFNYLCPPIGHISGVRRCQVTRHVGLAYFVSAQDIIIVSVFDSRSAHPFYL